MSKMSIALEAPLESTGPSVVGGVTISPPWPGSYRVWQITAGERRFVGSAVAVGPRAFLTAAHVLLRASGLDLMNNPAVRTFEIDLEMAGELRRAHCEVHPGYKPGPADDSADLLVGRFTGEREAFPGAAQRTIDFNRRLVREGSWVWISGFGQTDPTVELAGTFSVGRAIVEGGNGAFAVRVRGPARLGRGDSGGGVYSDGPRGEVAGDRLVGIGYEIVEGRRGQLESGVVTLSNRVTARWLKEWSRRLDEPVLGVPRPIPNPLRPAA